MLDTETTGLSPQNGDRMVEIGAIEVSHRKLHSDRTFHHYINPQRDIPEAVVRIHGINNAKIKDKPTFEQVADEFLEFIQGATLVIHNAAFDLGFIMNELALFGKPEIDHIPVIDTLELARKQHPQQRNNLDALCDRYGVERGHRELHGALLDSELLAEVYLGMTGGRQFSLGMEVQAKPASSFVQISRGARSRDEKAETAKIMRRDSLKVPEDDHAAHEAMLKRIHQESNGQLIWKAAE
ncbi:DNA polymerase III subunit epsilon [Pseudomonadota bacterium]